MSPACQELTSDLVERYNTGEAQKALRPRSWGTQPGGAAEKEQIREGFLKEMPLKRKEQHLAR